MPACPFRPVSLSGGGWFLPAVGATYDFNGHETGWSSLSIGPATNGWSACPIAPRQWFVTLSAAC